MSKKIIIVGGGISGLSTAYFIQEQLASLGDQVDCYLIEGRERLGGVILTEVVDGFVIEGGPDSFLSTKPWALELCQKLGLTDRLIGTREDQRKTYVFSRGRLEELPEGLTFMIPTQIRSFLRSGLISLPGKIRMGLDLLLPRKVGREDESLGAFIRRRLGREVLERIAEPLLGGIYAGQIDQMSLQATFPNFQTLEQEYRSLIWGMLRKRREIPKSLKTPSKWTLFVTLRGGLTELVQTLTTQLNRISFIKGKPVVWIKPSSDSSSLQPVYHLTLANGEILQADVIVLATPAYIAADFVESFNSSLAAVLREIPYTSTVTISLGYKKSDFAHLPPGFGFVVPRVENRRIIASTWTSNKYPHRAPDDKILLRCYIGGANQEDLVSLEDRILIQIVREELREIAGITQEPVLTRVYRWEKVMPQYLVGHLNRLTTLERLLTHHPGLFLTGNAYRGPGIPDCIHSGALTAEKVLKYLQLSSGPQT
ncbi:MAG TPA: protoporphyrinogen oxidase [Candidatus Limnocylindrales bacterium]|nr:protoporphyrinogen oxidase [Candidatus Limnocylindrales bacterium]